MNIIDTLNDDSFKEFQELIIQNPELLSTKDEDGWDLISLSTHYGLKEHVSFLLDKLQADKLNGYDKSPSPLYIALENENIEIANMLISNQKININQKLRNGETAIFYAIDNDDLDMATALINRGIDLTIKNNQDISAITHSLSKNNSNIFNLFNDNYDLKSLYEDSWINYVIKFGNVKILETIYPLFKGNIDTLFKNAVGFEKVEVVSFLVDTGAFIPGEQQLTQIVELMCKKQESEDEKKASVNLADFLFSIKIPFYKFKNANGQNAWMLAIENSNDEIFDRLLKEQKENVNTVDDKKETPLFYAVANGSLHYVTKLLEKKGNPNHKNNNNDTILINAVRKNRGDIVDAILKYPTKINDLNNNNENALSIAIHYRKYEVISKLIWAGGEITSNPAKFNEENDVYHINISGAYEKIATERNDTQINDFIALAQLGFNLNQRNENGDTFLLHFIKEGYLTNFKAMLNCPLNYKEVDSNGNDALMVSIKKRSSEYFNTLLFRNPNLDLSTVNKEGKNIYDLAIEIGDVERIQKLIDYDKNISKRNSKKIQNYLNINQQNSPEIEKIREKFNQNLNDITKKNQPT